MGVSCIKSETVINGLTSFDSPTVYNGAPRESTVLRIYMFVSMFCKCFILFYFMLLLLLLLFDAPPLKM